MGSVMEKDGETLLRNDYWCKGIGFSQPKSEAYEKYKILKSKMKDRGCEKTK